MQLCAKLNKIDVNIMAWTSFILHNFFSFKKSEHSTNCKIEGNKVFILLHILLNCARAFICIDCPFL
jgi:hypothetical protein